MIKQHFVRAFERGARRGHRTNIGLKADTCEVIFDMEDSTNNDWNQFQNDDELHLVVDTRPPVSPTDVTCEQQIDTEDRHIAITATRNL
jgi:hypothetical protein